MNFRKKILELLFLLMCKIIVHLEKWINIHTIRFHSVWLKPILQTSTIVDLGSNKGDFSRYFFENEKCGSIFCVEANPELAKCVTELLPVDVSNLAITNCIGEFDFVLSENLEASTLFPDMATLWGKTQCIKVPGIPLEEYLKRKQISHVSLLKMDVEGAEIDILREINIQTLEKIDQMAIEFHDFLNPDLLPDVKKTIQKLEYSGFFCIIFDHPRHENTLFINKKILKSKEYWLDYCLLMIMKLLLMLKEKWHQHLQII